MESTKNLYEDVIVGNFVDSNTFLDDDGNPIPLIKSEFNYEHTEDEIEDTEMDNSSSSENELSDDGESDSGESNSDSKESDIEGKQSKSSDKDSEDETSSDAKNTSSSSSKGGSENNDSSASDNSSDTTTASDSQEDSDKSDSSQSSSSQQGNKQNNKTNNQQDKKKPDPEVFKNQPKKINQGGESDQDDAIQYDLDDQPLVYGDQQSQAGGGADKPKRKIAPNPNKIYKDTKTGKSYKFDYDKGKFVEVVVRD